MTLTEYIESPPGGDRNNPDRGQGLKSFLDTEVYFKRPRDADAASDRPLCAGDAVDWPLEARRIDDLVSLVFYTSHDHPRLLEDGENTIATLPLSECLQLSFDFPGADGVVLVTPRMYWKAFRKENLEPLVGSTAGGYR